MFDGLPVLVVEDDATTALDITQGIEDAGGYVVGPVRTVAEALVLVDTHLVAAAVLDVNSPDRDIMPMAVLLAERGVPIVIYSAVGLPINLIGREPPVVVVSKSQPLSQLIERLRAAQSDAEEEVQNRLRGSRTASVLPITVTFDPANVLVGRGRRTGRLALADGNLAGVLIPVSANEAGDGGPGGWYLEAVFGTCGGPDSVPPQVFIDLEAAAAWIEERLACQARHYHS